MPKTTTKKPTTGEKLTEKHIGIIPGGYLSYKQQAKKEALARAIDAAIRMAVTESYVAGYNERFREERGDIETAEAHRERIRNKYGARL